MYFKQFLHDESGCASYFVASRQSREAMVIDPQIDVQPYIDLAAERDYRITDVIDTHLHADHVSGNRKLAEKTGARLSLHESAEVRFPFNPLTHGQEVPLGQLIIRVVYTPGHRPESICLLMTNPLRSPMPSICGKGMCGRPSSTIGFERRFNPVLQLSAIDFLHNAEEVPARPLNMTAILATNRGEGDFAWAMPHDLHDVPDVSTEQAPGWLEQTHAMVLDVREPAEYAAGHVPGAMSIPQADLAVRLDELPRGHDLLVVCEGGTRSARAARFLKQVGFPNVTNLVGGTSAWRRAGLPTEG